MLARLDALNAVIGRMTSWLALGMVAAVVVIVVLRYALDVNPVWLQELLTWLHAAVFMLGAAYTLRDDEHVRVDIFYRKMTARQRAWVNAAGTVLFLFPMCAFLLWVANDYVLAAWQIREVSRDSGGLPYPAIPLLKTFLLLMPLLVTVQGVVMLARSVKTIRAGDSER